MKIRKENILTNIIIVLLFTFFCQAQNKTGYTPPSIDDNDKIPVVKTELPVPDEGNDYVVKYFKGITDGVESRIAVKKMGYIIRPAMVQVFSRDGRELAIELVKNNWDDIVRSGTTKNGTYESSFKTALEFGIKISAKEVGIPFIVVVSAGVELFPTSNLFVDVSTMKSASENDATQPSKEIETNSESSKSIIYLIIAIALIGIFILLAVLIFKKNGKGAATLILFMMILPLNAGIVPTNQEFVVGVLGNLGKSLGQHYGKGGFGGDGPLSEDDKNSEPQLDPRGQPSLPSSCYKVAEMSLSGSGGSGSSSGSGDSNSNSVEGSKTNNNSNSNPNTDEYGREKKDLFGKDIMHDDFNHPKYDAEGNPIDYPEGNRPKYDKDGKPIQYQDNNRPKYDIEGNEIKYDENSAEPKPKYDKDGKLINYNSDNKPVFDNNGKPIKYDDSQKPKYDKNGKPIKYPDPKKPKYDKDGKLIRYGYGATLNSSTSKASFLPIFSISDKDETEEGCACLESAYADLQKRRYSLEKLLKIGQHTKKVTDYGISFGDDFSGVHGVAGLAWQTQRAEILKSIDKFDVTYTNKYNELIKKLYDALIQIDECERKLGYENWYSQSGFIYYEFMKVRYASYK
jgi:hypothetical protein